MDIEIGVGDFEIPIKYSTEASHLPPSSEAQTRLTSTLSNLLEVGSNLPQNVECHTHFQCPETVGKRACKGTVAVVRQSDSDLEWRCRQCMTRGILKNSRYERRYTASEEKCIALTFPKKEFSALNELRGLPPDAHEAIMCSRYLIEGGMMIAESKAYLDLRDHISEDLEEGFCKKTSERSLVSALDRILEAICYFDLDKDDFF